MADSQALKLLKRLREANKPEATFGQAAAQGGAEGLLQNLLGVPEFIARGARGGANVLRGVTGNEMVPIPPEGLLGLPTARELISGVEAGAGGLLGTGERGFGEFGPRFDEAIAAREQVQKSTPFGQAVGEVGADVLTVLTGRAPLLSKVKRTQTGTTDLLAPALKEGFDKMLREGASKSVSKIIGRVTEGGLEAGALALLKGEDNPERQAVLAGTSQAAGMLGLRLSEVVGFKDLLRGKIIQGGSKLGASAFAVGAVIQFLKTVVPGGRDFILESIEAGFDKIPLALTLGALSALTGAGRLKGGQLPIVKGEIPTLLMDALTTIPRAATIKLIRQANDDPDVARTVDLLLTSPESFKPKTLLVLKNAFENGNLQTEVNRLSNEDEEFIRILNAPHPKLMGTPVKE